MNLYRTTTLAAALSLAALSAHAAPPMYGETYPATPATPSTLTRAEVVADLVAARQAGTLPRTGDWSNAPAPLAIGTSTRSRAEVREEAIAAAHAGRTAFGEQ